LFDSQVNMNGYFPPRLHISAAQIAHEW